VECYKISDAELDDLNYFMQVQCPFHFSTTGSGNSWPCLFPLKASLHL